MRKSILIKISCIALLLLSSWRVYAGEAPTMLAFTDAGHQIIDEVFIDENSDCSIITVRFNFPVRYVRHFPKESGNELRIKLSLMAVKPALRKSLFARESVLPPPNDIADLSNVNYEGDLGGGPYLTLFFKRTVTFKVESGGDFRSMTISVKGRDASRPCW
ncbi:MAG: hypothetical protein ACE5GM_06110 [bacterium]